MSLLELISALMTVVGMMPMVMGLALLVYAEDKKQIKFCLGLAYTGVLISSIGFIIFLII